MRVIAGSARGRRLVAPKGSRVRPTTDRVRQSLMDMLAPWTAGRWWLDLYAGSGAVGIEALSRGAAHVVFVERDRLALAAIESNLRRAGVAERAEILRGDVTTSVTDLERRGARFHVVFADPPYGQGLALRVLSEVGSRDLLTAGGLLVIQHDAHEEPVLPPELPQLALARRVSYGETQVSVFARGQEVSP